MKILNAKLAGFSKRIRSRKRPGVDKYMLLVIVAITGFGLVMVYDASVVYSDSVFSDKYRFFTLQLVWISLGYIGMWIFSTLDLDLIRRNSYILFTVTIFFLLFLLLPNILGFLESFAPSVYGARRWLILNPSPLPSLPFLGRISFQPSELTKLASIIFFAAFLSSKKILGEKPIKAFIKFLALLGFVFLLVAAEPDFTTAAIIVVILVSMYFLSGGKVLYLSVIAFLMPIIASVYALSSEYRRLRIKTLFDPESIDKLGSGYHIRQIMIALGSGGFWGLGLGKSRQKFAYLPEVTADSIFAIVGEELGFVGSVAVVGLIVFLALRGLRIAERAGSQFERLLVVGVISWLAFQSFINLLAMARIIPLTGVPLPLISYGGSSTLFLMCALGLVLNVSRNVRLD